MTVESNSDARFGVKPILLYTFTHGSVVARYCDAATDQTYNSNLFSAIPIQIGPITTSGSLDDSEVKITIPQDEDIAQRFLVFPPSQETSVVVQKAFIGDTDFAHHFTGKVLTMQRREDLELGAICEMSCEPVIASIRRPGLKTRYQFGCMRKLYQTGCAADKTRATRAQIVQSVGNTTVTLSAGWEGTFQREDFLNGEANWTNDDGDLEVRTILKVTETVVTLSGFTTDLSGLDTINLILGCRKTESDCLNLHEKAGGDPVIRDFGGFPGIPNINPVGGAINVFY